jgi:hypothetical protein
MEYKRSQKKEEHAERQANSMEITYSNTVR